MSGGTICVVLPKNDLAPTLILLAFSFAAARAGPTVACPALKRRHLTDRFSSIQRPVLEPFNLIRKFAPAEHEFQISLFDFQIFSSPRCNGAFHRPYPEPFRSRGHGELTSRKFGSFRNNRRSNFDAASVHRRAS